MTDHRAIPAAVAFALLLASAARAAAQDIRVGAEVGASLSTFGGEGVEDLDEYRSGLVVGLSLARPLNDLLQLESGARWIEKGAEGSVLGFEEAISADVRLRYVQVPLLLRFSPFAGNLLQPSLALGPAVSFETGCRYDQEMSPVFVLVGCADEERAHTDVSLLFGGGITWRLGSARLLFEGRYDVGLRDLDRADALETHNRAFTITPRLSIPVPW